MKFNDPEVVLQQSRAERRRSLKIRLCVIGVLLLFAAVAAATVWNTIQEKGAKNLALVSLKNANQDVARLTQEKLDLSRKLKEFGDESSDQLSKLQVHITEQDAQLQAFAKQAKACEVLRSKLKQ